MIEESGQKIHELMKVIHCISYYIPHLKVHFHSRKFSTDRKFSENIIVKGWKCLQNFFWNKYECRHKLISAQFGKVIWILAMNFRTPRWKPRTWLHISSSLFTHYSDSPFNRRDSSPGLGYIWFTLDTVTSRSDNKPQFTQVGQNVQWFPLYVGQFHE
jgi:hypothetical protein